jgi:hypothetical protein
MRSMRRKTCRTCCTEKLIGQFYRHPTNADRRMHVCKSCWCAYTNENYALKRERRLEVKRAYVASEAGKATRQRYLDNGGRELHNANRRLMRRIQRMDQVGA